MKANEYINEGGKLHEFRVNNELKKYKVSYDAKNKIVTIEGLPDDYVMPKVEYSNDFYERN